MHDPFCRACAADRLVPSCHGWLEPEKPFAARSQSRTQVQLLAQERKEVVQEDESRLSQHHDVSAAAHESYLKGWWAEWSKRNDGDNLKQALLKSIEYFEEAIRADPEYALAYAGMADSYIVAADSGSLRALITDLAKRYLGKAWYEPLVMHSRNLRSVLSRH